MPVVKPISGHTGCGGIMRYLEKGGRALAVDLVNLSWSPGRPCGFKDWADEMDFTRVAFGNHLSWKGRPARTYKHYIVSPDPRDEPTLDALREFAQAWVSENFGGFQAAIVYHDDNEGGVMHAHVVVNNTNLETGGRLQDPDPRALMRSAQRLAQERGMRFFADDRPAERTVRFGARVQRPKESVHFRRAERELLDRGGYSWVADIRSRVLVARRAARDEADFLAILGELGVEVSDASARNDTEDWVYGIAGKEARRIRGENLGTSFGRRAVRQELALRSSPRRAEVVREIARCAVEIGDLGDLGMLADSLDAFAREGIRSMADCEARLAEMEAAGDFESMERLAGYRDYAEEKGLLPQRSSGGRRRPIPPPDEGSAGGRRTRAAASQQRRASAGGRERDGRDRQR